MDDTLVRDDAGEVVPRRAQAYAPTPGGGWRITLNNADNFGATNVNATAADMARWLAFFRSEEHTSELQSLMRISYAVFCLKKKKKTLNTQHTLNCIPPKYHQQSTCQLPCTHTTHLLA